ncbi:hypothetical protein VTK26DRAFT_5848 [Humicola hyalothermophila]
MHLVSYLRNYLGTIHFTALPRCTQKDSTRKLRHVHVPARHTIMPWKIRVAAPMPDMHLDVDQRNTVSGQSLNIEQSLQHQLPGVSRTATGPHTHPSVSGCRALAQQTLSHRAGSRSCSSIARIFPGRLCMQSDVTIPSQGGQKACCHLLEQST